MGTILTTQPSDPILEPTELLKDFYIKPFPTCNITLQPRLCAQNNFIMLYRTKKEKRDLKNTELDKTAAIKTKKKTKKQTVSVKVLDVTYLFHLRLDFFVKEQKINETEWHLERLKALILINADVKVIQCDGKRHFKQTYISDM